MLTYLSTTLLTLLLLSVPVAVTLVLLGIGVDIFFSPFPLTKAIGQNFWSAANSFLLLAIPLFILMGQLIVKSGIAARAYRTLDYWLSWLPGGLLHSNIVTSTFFSATETSGEIVAPFSFRPRAPPSWMALSFWSSASPEEVTVVVLVPSGLTTVSSRRVTVFPLTTVVVVETILDEAPAPPPALNVLLL